MRSSYFTALLASFVITSPAYSKAICTDESCACVQSPIDITHYINADLPDIKYNYGKIDSKVTIREGKFIVEPTDSKYGMSVENSNYALKQFHLHVPSEHHIKGKAADMEIHFVHTNDKEEISVVGVLVTEGGANTELNKVITQLKKHSEDTLSINYDKLLPKDRRYFLLIGSLTTAPYQEGVRWQVINKPITASKEQIEYFKQHNSYTARPIMPIKNRLVIKDIR